MRKAATAIAAGLLGLAAATALAKPPVEIEAPGPKGPLKGTLIEANAPGGPVVLIIPGSGPTDRDGNSPLGILAAPYRLLAEALAARGVTTARIDKRGMFGSAPAGAANAVRVRDYAADIRSWTRTLQARTGARCIWLLGHSEGALMSLAAAAANPEGYCGLVLVSGAGRRLSDVVREQLRAAPQFAPHLEQALAAIDRLDAGKRVDSSGMSPVLLSLFAPEVQDYLIDSFAHDPAQLAKGLRLPILVLQGQRDLQTTEVDARRLAGANKEARLVLLPDVNHVLKTVGSDNRAANLATYANPNLPLAPGVAEAVAEFVKR